MLLRVKIPSLKYLRVDGVDQSEYLTVSLSARFHHLGSARSPPI